MGSYIRMEMRLQQTGILANMAEANKEASLGWKEDRLDWTEFACWGLKVIWRTRPLLSREDGQRAPAFRDGPVWVLWVPCRCCCPGCAAVFVHRGCGIQLERCVQPTAAEVLMHGQWCQDYETAVSKPCSKQGQSVPLLLERRLVFMSWTVHG